MGTAHLVITVLLGTLNIEKSKPTIVVEVLHFWRNEAQ
jgi:hypothetical protein